MTTYRSYLVAAGCAAGLLVSLSAPAIDSVKQAIATPTYTKSMRSLDMMKKIDANGDHMVSRDEITTYYGDLFDKLDADHDGTLDRKEWIGIGRDKEMATLATGGYARELSSMKMMNMIDTDHDHTVSKAEFVAAHQAMYDHMAAGQSGPLDTKQWVANYFPK